MAYGKDRAVLQGTGSFRQKMGAYSSTKEENRGAGRGAAPYFVGQFKPPFDDVATIRLIEGHYKVPQAINAGTDEKGKTKWEIVEQDLPCYPFTEHFDGRNRKSSLCSAGPLSNDRDQRDPCHGCDLFWSSMEAGPDGKKKKGRMSKRDLFAWSMIDYGRYHKMPQIDQQTGQVRRNDNNEPYTQWVPCNGIGCDGCKSGAETTQGQTRHWSMGTQHYATLMGADDEVGKSCANCCAVGSILGRAWLCPQCGEGVIDLQTTSLKKEQVKEVTMRPYHCNCGFNGFLQELIECRSCTPAGGKARRATLFDVDIQVKRVKTGSGDNEQTVLQVVAFSPPQPVAKGFEQLHKALPLEKSYAPTPIENQASLFGVSTQQQRSPRTAADISSQNSPPASAFIPTGQLPGMGAFPQPPVMGAQFQPPQPPMGGFAPPQQPQFQPPPQQGWQPPTQSAPPTQQPPYQGMPQPAPAPWPMAPGGLIPPKQ